MAIELGGSTALRAVKRSAQRNYRKNVNAGNGVAHDLLAEPAIAGWYSISVYAESNESVERTRNAMLGAYLPELDPKLIMGKTNCKLQFST